MLSNQELDLGRDLVYQVLKEEELHVAGKVAEQPEEVWVPGEAVTERVRQLTNVVPADALHRQIEPSLIFGWNPRAPLSVGFRSTLFAGKTIVPLIV
jgi:hypothetical protein